MTLERIPLAGIRCWRECSGITDKEGCCPVCGTVSVTIRQHENDALEHIKSWKEGYGSGYAQAVTDQGKQ